jgi:hypothetical protein
VNLPTRNCGISGNTNDHADFAIIRDAPELAEAIHVIFMETPATDKDMREAVADTLEWHPTLLDKPEIETSIMEINGLAYELLRRSRRAEPEYD